MFYAIPYNTQEHKHVWHDMVPKTRIYIFHLQLIFNIKQSIINLLVLPEGLEPSTLNV